MKRQKPTLSYIFLARVSSNYLLCHSNYCAIPKLPILPFQNQLPCYCKATHPATLKPPILLFKSCLPCFLLQSHLICCFKTTCPAISKPGSAPHPFHQVLKDRSNMVRLSLLKAHFQPPWQCMSLHPRMRPASPCFRSR